MKNKKRSGVKKAGAAKHTKKSPKAKKEVPKASKFGTYLTYGILALIIIGTFFYIINVAYKQALVGRAYQFVLEDTTVIPGQPLSLDLVSEQPKSVNLNVQGPAEKALMSISGAGKDVEVSVGAEKVYSSLGNLDEEKLVIGEFDNVTEELAELPKAITITVPR